MLRASAWTREKLHSGINAVYQKVSVVKRRRMVRGGGNPPGRTRKNSTRKEGKLLREVQNAAEG